MAQGKKTSSEKIVAVVTAKIANPDLSSREIEEQVGDVDHSTVSRILENDLQQLATSSDKAQEMFNTNIDIINIGLEKVKIAMDTLSPEKISEAKEMQSIVDTAFKQNQLIQGKATDKVVYSIESFEQAKEALKDILK